VARAKSTERAEARRRHRAATAAAVAEGPLLEVAPTAPRSNGGGSGSAAPARTGLLGSFRSAIRPVHFREDLQDLPRLATKTFAIWVPAVLLIAVFGAFEASGGNISNQSVQALAFNLFIFPPPLAAAFLAGILTQRSSYLAGLIIGLLAGVLFAIYVLTANFTSTNGEVVTDAIRMQNALYSMVVSPIAGLAVGGFSGFYRRFLRMANPNAANRAAARNAKPAPRRR
jgi:hypothetical protein